MVILLRQLLRRNTRRRILPPQAGWRAEEQWLELVAVLLADWWLHKRWLEAASMKEVLIMTDKDSIQNLYYEELVKMKQKFLAG